MQSGSDDRGRDKAFNTALRVEAQQYLSPYVVIDTRTGKEVKSAFIFFPEQDSAGRVAMAAYAEATINVSVSRYIRGWLSRIHQSRVERNKV